MPIGLGITLFTFIFDVEAKIPLKGWSLPKCGRKFPHFIQLWQKILRTL